MTSFAAKLKAMNAIINVDNSQLWSSQNFNNWAEEDHNCFTGTMVTGDLVHPPLSIRMVVFYNPPPPPPPPSVALCPIRTAHYAKVLRLIIALRSHNLCLLWCFNVYMRTNEKSTAREKNDEREGERFKTFPPRCSFRDLQFSLTPSFVRLHQPRTWKKLVIACLVAD